MASELDKKIQKTQTDLAQSVLEAFEKRNLDRVDMLVSNAIKQLKISRFKPDQSTCMSLIYLARICPTLFAQSANIRELLKTHIRRDNGNIKGTKNDTVLPLLSANILLACCDSAEVKSIILNRLEQWLCSNQKANEMMLHLLAVLCTKCQGDQQTIETLIDMRPHWQQYFEENFDLYGRMPVELCVRIRKLIYNKTNCETLIDNLRFLIKHDDDIIGLSKELSEFIVKRPITIDCMLQDTNHGDQLYLLLLKIYNNLFRHLKKTTDKSLDTAKLRTNSPEEKSQLLKTDLASETSAMSVDQPTHTNGLDVKNVKLEYKLHVGSLNNISKNEPNIKSDETNGSSNESVNVNFSSYVPPLYMRLSTTNEVVAVDRATMQAVLTLLATFDMEIDNRKTEFGDLLECWLVDMKKINHAFICEDVCMTTAYQLPIELRRKLIHSTNNCMIELALQCASAKQLIDLLQQFGLRIETIDRILTELVARKGIENLRSSNLKSVYFDQLMEFYSEMGAKGVQELCQLFGTTTSV